MNWYILQVFSLNFLKAVYHLRFILGEENFYCPLVFEKKYNRKISKVLVVEKPLFLDYVFVRTDNATTLQEFLSDNLKGFFRFLEMSGRLWIVPEDEMSIYREQERFLRNRGFSKVRKDDIVIITEGAFKGLIGNVSRVYNDRADVLVKLFNRDTLIEVLLHDLEVKPEKT